ncbi:YncE family protein [Aspergillus lucknowensis]|uniref:Uncharacterized protein n=1 Tax=Aspergillus lucknowensis TaxID=176173 RepID=A0ABR4M711_9EURO
MHFSIKTALLLAASTSAFPSHHADPKAVYVLTNTEDNAVIGLPVGHDGLLKPGHVTLTGGRGGTALTAPGTPSGPDALFSQAPLYVAGEYIFAVNPGSNTVSMLKVHPHHPALLTPIGEPAAIPGEFPITVAASLKNSLVCVGTTGALAGISCGPFNEHGIGALDALRPYALNQTTPPIGPPNTVTHTFFSDDETHLLTTVKGVPMTDNIGFLSVFEVLRDDGACRPNGASASLSRHDTRSALNGTNLLFGAALIPHSSRVFVTDPSFGVAVLDLNEHSDAATLETRMPIPGQMALCWAAYSAKRNSVFTSDGARNRIVEVDADDASIVSAVDLPNDDPSGLDLIAAGDLVYLLSPGNGTTDAAVTVWDAAKEKQVQRFSLKEYGGDRNAVGIGAFQGWW